LRARCATIVENHSGWCSPDTTDPVVNPGVGMFCAFNKTNTAMSPDDLHAAVPCGIALATQVPKLVVRTAPGKEYRE
jgi:hypothetical protein